MTVAGHGAGPATQQTVPTVRPDLAELASNTE